MRTIFLGLVGTAAALAAILIAAPARADKVASPQEVRALRARLAKSPPAEADLHARPYPGALFDADCSAQETAPRQPGTWGYCFYTRDPLEKVRAFVAAEGKPRDGVTMTVGEDTVAVDGVFKIDRVTMIKYWVMPSVVAYYQGFPAEPPPAAELIAPLYAGATYDRECSAAKSLEAKGKPKWRQVWCYVAREPAATVGKAFDTELKSTSKRGVQVDIVTVSSTPPVTQIQYWMTTAPPVAAGPASAPPAAAAAPSQAATPEAGQPPAPAQDSAAAPSTAPSSPAPSAGEAIETISKLRGLFKR